eukprot:gene6346-12834_t
MRKNIIRLVLVALNFHISSGEMTAPFDYASYFYELAQTRFQGKVIALVGPIHLIRIPKASSSSLSAVARRIAGCVPYGPCCKYPGDPPGSCPVPGLFACHTEGKVIGCTGHNSNYPTLLNPNIPTISMMRSPYSRSISAFFYAGSQHNKWVGDEDGSVVARNVTMTMTIIPLPPHVPFKCNRGLHICFLEYTSGFKWRNVAVKLMAGGNNAYAMERTCRLKRECRLSLELALKNLVRVHFMGVSEMWELSMLVLHIKMPSLRPLLMEFKSSSSSSSSSSSQGNSSSSAATPYYHSTSLLTTTPTTSSSSSSSFRVNTNDVYTKFKVTAAEKYAKQLKAQNGLDYELYVAVLELFCAELKRLSLWEDGNVRRYWSERSHSFGVGNSTTFTRIVDATCFGSIQ